jgi:hypothetical protein
MTIYSDPIDHPGKPENAMRARAGLRPLCFNRPDFPSKVRANLQVEDDGPFVSQVVGEIENPMTKDCKSWAVHPAEDPATESVPGRECWRCFDCRRLPSDPRVVIRAAASELW